MPGVIWLCGKKHPMADDLEQVLKFAEFLRGENQRCPVCLHKAKNHKKKGPCAAASGTCTCNGTREWVSKWHGK